MFDQDIVSVQAAVRRRDHYFEPCAAIFEYEDPAILGMMDVSYAPAMWLRSDFYGADEFFEIQGDEGFLWVTRCTGQLLDLPAVVLYDGTRGKQTTTSFPHVDDDSGSGIPPGVPALHRHPGRRRGARDERRGGRQGAAAVLRRLRGRQHPPGRGSAADHRPGGPGRVAPVNVTRTLHHSVNVEGRLDACVAFYRRLLDLSDEERPEIPGVGGHWFAAGDVQLHLVDADAGSAVIRPTGPHVCFAVDDLDGCHRRARAGRHPLRAGAQGTVVQIWFVDPAGNTIEIQQDRGRADP